MISQQKMYGLCVNLRSTESTLRGSIELLVHHTKQEQIDVTMLAHTLADIHADLFLVGQSYHHIMLQFVKDIPINLTYGKEQHNGS